MKHIYFSITIIITLTTSQAQDLEELNSAIQIANDKIVNIESQLKTEKNKVNELKCKKIIADLKTVGYPQSSEGVVIEHKAMVLNYVEKHEQANWVFHRVLTDINEGNQSRTNDFRVDELIETGSAVEEDYFLKTTDNEGNTTYDGFGYDRGHLAPSADFRWNQEALSESYLYSNMSPQLADFNRGKWGELEGFLRGYIFRNNRPLYVITGGILNKNLIVIERSINKVSIPKYFYKIAYDSETKQAIGFILPNKRCDKNFEAYACSIDSIEKLTSIDFFTKLDESIEKKIESTYDYNKWIPTEESKINVKPLDPLKLPKKCFNTIQAKLYMDQGDKITVCGTVVSTKKSGKGNVYLNLDKAFPNQIFSISIWSSNIVNFSYEPHIVLKREQVCVTGKVGSFNGVPSMNITKEEQIEINPFNK